MASVVPIESTQGHSKDMVIIPVDDVKQNEKQEETQETIQSIVFQVLNTFLIVIAYFVGIGLVFTIGPIFVFVLYLTRDKTQNHNWCGLYFICSVATITFWTIIRSYS